MRDEQPNPIIFFLDKTHGKLIREILRGVKLQVMMHKELGWLHNMKDTAIIQECAARNWVIVSGDKHLARVPEERQAIINGKCKVFMFDDSHKTRTEDWIAAFLVGRERILDIIAKTRGPLFVTVKPCRAKGHISLPDFVEKTEAGWLAEDELPPRVTIPISHPDQGSQRPPKKQQGELDFAAPDKTSV